MQSCLPKKYDANYCCLDYSCCWVQEEEEQEDPQAVQDEAQSSYPALGYTVPYALGNILLTAWGPVLVAMMSFSA